MLPDIALVLGVIFVSLAIPALLSAYSDGRVPRSAAVLIVLAAGLIYWAMVTHPDGYALVDVPAAFVRVIGGILH